MDGRQDHLHGQRKKDPPQAPGDDLHHQFVLILRIDGPPGIHRDQVILFVFLKIEAAECIDEFLTALCALKIHRHVSAAEEHLHPGHSRDLQKPVFNEIRLAHGHLLRFLNEMDPHASPRLSYDQTFH